MPEIAEVETIRLQLVEKLLDEQIESFESFHRRSIRRHFSPEEISARVVGEKIIGFIRHGKYLAIELSSGDYLNIHLRMSGRLLIIPVGEFKVGKLPKHSHVRIRTKRYFLVFIDPRTFGELWVTISMTDEMSNGIDALNGSHKEKLSQLENYAKSSRPLKSILLDQNILSGIGNIYADEICSDARVRPTRNMNELNKNDFVSLLNSIDNVLSQAVTNRGSSLRDESFRDLYGEIGLQQKFHVVHARKTCRKCGTGIVKTKIASRSTYFCPSCQT